MQGSLLFEIDATILSASFHKQITNSSRQLEATPAASFRPPAHRSRSPPRRSAQPSCSSLPRLVQLTEQGASEPLPSFHPSLTLE